MATLTIVGDPHAKPDNLDKINTLFNIVEDLGNATIWLGDLLDTKEVVRAKCLNLYLRRFAESNFHHFVLVGNHDWFNLDCQDHSLEALKALPNVTVVDKPWSQGRMVLFPYTHDAILFREWLRKHVREGDHLFCHADIQGFDFGNGLISEEGLDPADFVKAQKVISGHYHKHQVFSNITYLGTPFSHSFGESDQEKYIGLYDLDKDKLELLNTPFPRHRTIDLDCNKYSGHHCNDVDYFRVILRGTQEEIDRVKREEGVKYIEMPTTALKKAAINETMSTEQQFERWATEVKGYSKDVVDLGLEVLRDV